MSGGDTENDRVREFTDFRKRMNERILAGMKAPLFFSVPDINRVEITVPATDIGDAIYDRGRCAHDIAGLEFPPLLTRDDVDRINISVVSAEVDHVIFEDRRRNHAIASWKFPFHAMELSRCRSRIRPGVHGIAAKHRLRLDRRRCAKRDKRNDNS